MAGGHAARYRGVTRTHYQDDLPPALRQRQWSFPPSTWRSSSARADCWSGRTFRDLADLDARAQAWRDDFANTREPRVTWKVPTLLVVEEQPRLLPLGERYDRDEWRPVAVAPDFRGRQTCSVLMSCCSTPFRRTTMAAPTPTRPQPWAVAQHGPVRMRRPLD